MVYIDTHCHLNDSAYDLDREEILSKAREAGVSIMVCVGADLAGSHKAVELTTETGVYASLGLHPESALEWNATAQAALQGLYRQCRKIIAYGEIGLDYHWETLSREQQQKVFLEQVSFAATLDPCLPLIIHCRDAQTDLLRLLKEFPALPPVVFHCFTGDIDAAREILDAGYFLGIGGVITFKKSDALRAAVAAAPLDRLLLETDCPYLAPQSWRGKRNEPAYLPAIAQTVAECQHVSLQEIADTTTANACLFFGIDPAPSSPS